MIRTAHFIWLGSEPPADYLENISEFSRLNPDWAIAFWTSADRILEVIPKPLHRLWGDATDIVPEDSVWQFRADIARLAILYAHGGMYADVDHQWFKPIDPLLEGTRAHEVLTVWEREGHHVANGWIYAPSSHHRLFKSLLAEIPHIAKQRRGQRANRITGPSGQWTSHARRNPNVRILPAKYLIPWRWDQLDRAGGPEDYPEAYGAATWNHQQEIRGLR